MNFLAHISLSGENKDIQFGNFIADSVKGKSYNDYPKNIKEGILLHREIDYFTDNHILVKECIKLLRPTQGKYSSIVIDMFFDYFLSNLWNNYYEVPLEKFCNDFYMILEEKKEFIPQRIKPYYKRIIDENWLMKYKDKSDLQVILSRMDNRINHNTNMKNSISILENDEYSFKSNFIDFWNDLEKFVKKLI